MTIILHENVPSPELVKKYEELLEHYLSAHHLKVKILLYEDPLNIRSTVESLVEKREWIERLWISDVVINTPEVKDLSVTLFSDGIEESERLEAQAWGDAHHIQDILYRELKRLPTSPPQSGDPYWELWKKHPTHPS